MRLFAVLMLFLLCAPLVAQAGTGSDYRPQVVAVPKGQNYERDVRACQRKARNKSSKAGDVATGAALGAGGGALIGGAISGDYGLGALAGAVAGGVGGHVSDEDDREQFVKDCMEDKGYELDE